jgi:hypothetical protein
MTRVIVEIAKRRPSYSSPASLLLRVINLLSAPSVLIFKGILSNLRSSPEWAVNQMGIPNAQFFGQGRSTPKAAE